MDITIDDLSPEEKTLLKDIEDKEISPMEKIKKIVQKVNKAWDKKKKDSCNQEKLKSRCISLLTETTLNQNTKQVDLCDEEIPHLIYLVETKQVFVNHAKKKCWDATFDHHYCTMIINIKKDFIDLSVKFKNCFKKWKEELSLWKIGLKSLSKQFSFCRIKIGVRNIKKFLHAIMEIISPNLSMN